MGAHRYIYWLYQYVYLWWKCTWACMCLPCRVKVLQQEIWNECGHDDGQGGSESFEDVVCIFNDYCYDQAAQSLQTKLESIKTNTQNMKTTCTTKTSIRACTPNAFHWQLVNIRMKRNIMIKPVRQQLCRWWCCSPETFQTVWPSGRHTLSFLQSQTQSQTNLEDTRRDREAKFLNWNYKVK